MVILQLSHLQNCLLYQAFAHDSITYWLTCLLPRLCPHGFTFTWWGCYGLGFWYKPTELAHSFLLCSCVCFCLYGTSTGFHSFNDKTTTTTTNLPTTLHFLTLFSWSYICLTGPFNYISLYGSLPQSWYNPLWLTVPAGSPSRGGDVTVYVWHKPAELAHSLLFCSCVYFCLYGSFNCISFHKFSRQLSVFSLCSCGLSSALLVLSTIYLFMKVSFSPDIIPSGWLGSKHQLTN